MDEGIKEAPPGDNLTIGELADFLYLHPSMQLHSSTIYQLLRQGKLRAFKVGSNWRFSHEAIDRLVQLGTRQ